jgi:hypothetical protein
VNAIHKVYKSYKENGIMIWLKKGLR